MAVVLVARADDQWRAAMSFNPETPPELPPGEYAIVELFGHVTLVGRIAEIERFGTKMLAIEPFFNGNLLPAVFHGGAAIYRLTPCAPDVAWRKQPTRNYELPPTILATVPLTLLPPVEPAPRWSEADDDDGRPF
jgi:hypothetical protein